MKQMNTKFFVLILGVTIYFNVCKKDEPETPINPTDITFPCDFLKAI